MNQSWYSCKAGATCRAAAGAAVDRRPCAGDAGAAAWKAAGAGGVWQSGIRGAHPRQVLLQRKATIMSHRGHYFT